MLHCDHATTGSLRIDVSFKVPILGEKLDTSVESVLQLTSSGNENGSSEYLAASVDFFGVAEPSQMSEPISPVSDYRLDKMIEFSVDKLFLSDEGFARRYPSIHPTPTSNLNQCDDNIKLPGKRKHLSLDGTRSRESTPDASPTSTTWNEWVEWSGSNDEAPIQSRDVGSCSMSLLQQNLDDSPSLIRPSQCLSKFPRLDSSNVAEHRSKLRSVGQMQE